MKVSKKYNSADITDMALSSCFQSHAVLLIAVIGLWTLSRSDLKLVCGVGKVLVNETLAK